MSKLEQLVFILQKMSKNMSVALAVFSTIHAYNLLNGLLCQTRAHLNFTTSGPLNKNLPNDKSKNKLKGHINSCVSDKTADPQQSTI